MNDLLADDPKGMARHLRRLIDDGGLRARMGAASRHVARRYDMAAYREAFFSPSFQASLAGRWGADTIAAYLTELCDHTTTPNGVVGAKLMAPPGAREIDREQDCQARNTNINWNESPRGVADPSIETFPDRGHARSQAGQLVAMSSRQRRDGLPP